MPVEPSTGVLFRNVGLETRFRLKPVLIIMSGHAAILLIQMVSVVADFVFGRWTNWSDRGFGFVFHTSIEADVD